MALHHVFLPCPTSLIEVEASFLDAALAPLGISQSFRVGSDLIAFGNDSDERFLWISALNRSEQPVDKHQIVGVHIALKVKDNAQVDAFYKAAIEAGGKDNGAPGPRKNYPHGYYAFVISPGGHNIEAVNFD